MDGRVLVVDDEAGMRAGLAEVLRRGGFAVEDAATAEDALERLTAGAPDLLVTDLRLPGRSGVELLRELRNRGIGVPVVVITAHGTIEDAVAAMKLGAVDFLAKPFSPGDLLHLVTRTLERAPRAARAQESQTRRSIVTRDPAMLRLLEVADAVASSRAPALIQGESGTGKELLARHLHERGCRRARPFVAVNCAALPRELLESELFGHEAGTYPGALTRKIGKFELADGGTLLLDEVSELEAGLQAKLLRVLQEYEIDPVGSAVPLRIDVRVVATTNRRLRDLVETGRFRADLFYRLNAIPLVIPPLRERSGDVEVLVEHILERCGDGRAPRFDAGARAWLASRPWPGNVGASSRTCSSGRSCSRRTTRSPPPTSRPTIRRRRGSRSAASRGRRYARWSAGSSSRRSSARTTTARRRRGCSASASERSATSSRSTARAESSSWLRSQAIDS
jgi:DNA-binding NtrC family response regulator